MGTLVVFHPFWWGFVFAGIAGRKWWSGWSLVFLARVASRLKKEKTKLKSATSFSPLPTHGDPGFGQLTTNFLMTNIL